MASTELDPSEPGLHEPDLDEPRPDGPRPTETDPDEPVPRGVPRAESVKQPNSKHKGSMATDPPGVGTEPQV